MKREVLTLILMLISIVTYSQTISYEYDSAGNRITRTVVTLKSAETSSSEEEEEEIVTDTWDEMIITIYPNPTEGELQLSITGGGLKDSYTYKIYSSEGKLILNGNINELGTTTLSLSGESSGAYILVLSGNGENKSYKIIKQ
jgi:hypothetical protein